MAVAISLKNKISTEKTGTSQQDHCGFNFLRAVYASRQLALRFTKIALALSAEYTEYLLNIYNRDPLFSVMVPMVHLLRTVYASRQLALHFPKIALALSGPNKTPNSISRATDVMLYVISCLLND